MSTRGRGGKFMKPKRGGGKHFSRDLRPIDAEGAEKSMWASDSDNSSSEEESSEEESSDEEAPKAPVAGEQEMTREQRREAAKQRKAAAIAKKKGPVQVGDMPSGSESESSDDDDMPANPNHTAKAAKMAAKPVVAGSDDEAPKKKPTKPADISQMSRREREALQAVQAKQRYEKLHSEGKTEQARNDMERLQLVRQRREEESARKAAEKAEKEEHEKEKADQLARMERQRAAATAKKNRGNKKNFCAGRINPHIRQTSIAWSNAFHSTATRAQEADDFDFSDPAEEAHKAMLEAKRQSEEQDAARRRQQEEAREKLAAQRLFGNAQRRIPQTQTSQASQANPLPPQPQQQRQQRPNQQFSMNRPDQQFSMNRPNQQFSMDRTKQQPKQTSGSPRAVDANANRPLNRVQTAHRDGRYENAKANRSALQDTLLKKLDVIKSVGSMPSLDDMAAKQEPGRNNQPAPKPAPMPQFKMKSDPPPAPPSQPTVKPLSWRTAASTPQQAAPSPSAAEPSVKAAQSSETPTQTSQPSRSFEDDDDDIFASDMLLARKALEPVPVPPVQVRPVQVKEQAVDDVETNREIAWRVWQEDENRRKASELHQQNSAQEQSSPRARSFTELASSMVNPRTANAMRRTASGATPTPQSEPQPTSAPSGEGSGLSQEEERMLEALLARKNRLTAPPSEPSIESLFGEQDQQVRNALIDESKKRVQKEQAKSAENRQPSRASRFSTMMVNSRDEPDDTPFENAKSWNILKPRQQQGDQTRSQRQTQEGSGRYTPMSAIDIDARFEAYRQKRQPRVGGFDIESLNVEKPRTYDRSRPGQTCVRCGEPGHEFRNCSNTPKPGWVDRRQHPNAERFDRNAPRSERDGRQPREMRDAGQEMAAAYAPPASAEGSAEADELTPAEEEANRKIAERNARRASRFMQEDGDEAPRGAPVRGRRGRSEEVDDEDDEKPRRGRRSRFDDDDDAEGNFGAMRNNRDERKKARQAKKDKAAKEAARQAARQARRAEAMTPINLPEFVSVSKLAQLTNVTYQEMADKMEELGFENTSHDHVLGAEEAGLIAMEYNFDPTLGAQEEAEAEERDLKALPEPAPEDKEYFPVRPPVVAIMGHVDHGKTTILDYLRKSSIAASEHGGITQHIGAFSVALSSGKTITFLDTPGHAAFLEMRKRGATVTDIIILVVAADDSVKPQTIEAIKHAQSAQVPIIVAVNKIDKEEANVDRVKQDLARHGVEIEDYGGDTQVVPVSGKTGQGIDELEDAAVTLSEILDHRADTEGQVEGWVLEATTKKAGRVATVLVRRGTLKPGTIIVAGKTWARVRTLRNEAGVAQMSAGPGTPIEVDGWRDQPSAGDEVLQAPNEQKASDVVAFRDEKDERIRMAEDMEVINTQRREQQVQRDATKEAEKAEKAAEKAARASGTEVEPTARKSNTDVDENETPGHQTVPFIIKADVSGSVEAVSAYLLQMTNPLCSPTVLRASVGPVTEFDIEHADAAGGHIIAFNLPNDPDSAGRAERKGIKILEQNVIYRIVDDVRAVLEEKLPPQKIQKVTGEAEVAMSFEIGIGGRKKVKIAGLKVRNGVVTRNSRVRVTRGEEKVYDGIVNSLKNVKKDVQEMRRGTECGMGFDGWENFEVGDMIQTFEERTQKRTLPL
ncbi:initiation factor 2 [Aureobasidium subglaciale]|nr:initiation factor 2 [Aureobasidium subglaciale]